MIMADYWVIRNAQINVPDLYKEEVAADHHYRHGLHHQAIQAIAVISIH